MQAVRQSVPMMAPLYTVGPYAMYPLHVCSADAIAVLFTKICARGNPIMQGKPAEDLYRLGLAFYRKSVGSVASTVFLKGAEPVALMLAWDSADGGVWKGTDGPPESLRCHAAIGAAVFESRPQEVTQPGQQLFMSFAGVALPHPGQTLLMSMQIVAVLGAIAAGYTDSFGYATHPKTIEQANNAGPAQPGIRTTWGITYSDIEVTDEEVQKELHSIFPGRAECGVSNLVWSRTNIEEGREDFATLLEGLRPAGAQMVAMTRMLFDDDGYQMPMASL